MMERKTRGGRAAAAFAARVLGVVWIVALTACGSSATTGVAVGKVGLEKALNDAAPHVKVVCDGLEAYLGAQAKGFEEVQKDIEKKRIARTERRCTMLDTRTVCVSDSGLDRVVYANAFGQLTALE